MANHSLIELPELAEPNSDSFDTRPESVEQWIKELPMADTGDATHKIFQVLREVNRLNIPAKERFEFLEMIAEPLEEILPVLRRHFINQPYPLPIKGRKIARLSSQLQAEMVIGYRHIFGSSKKVGWLGKTHFNRLLPTCIHRILHYIDGIIYNYSLVYERYPRGLWEYAHRLYRRCEKAGKLSERVSAPGKNGNDSTLMQEYLRLLLVSLIPLHKLRPDQMTEMLSGMDVWTDMSNIESAEYDEMLPYMFYVRLDSDLPPAATFDQGAAHYPREAKLRLIDTSALVAHLRALLMSEGERIDIGSGVWASRMTLKQLLEYWRSPKVRSQERFAAPEDISLDVVIGMKPIHSQISTALEKMDKGRRGGDDALMQRDDETLHSWMEDTGEWDLIELHVEEPEPNYWVQEFEAHHHGGMIESSVLNKSRDGYCISLPVKRIENIYEGELLGLRQKDEEMWDIASIHWLQDKGDGHLNVGIQVIALDAYPVIVKINRGLMGISEPIECFVATNEDMDAIIFLPYLPGIATKELILEYKEHATPMELVDKIKESPSFEAYTFSVAKLPAFNIDDERSRRLWLRM